MASMCWCRWCVLARLFAHRPRCRRVRSIKSRILLGLRGVRMRGVSTGRRRRRGKAIEAVHCCRPACCAVVPLAFLCCAGCVCRVPFSRCCKMTLSCVRTVRTKQRASLKLRFVACFVPMLRAADGRRPTDRGVVGGGVIFTSYISTRCRDSLYSWAAVAAS